MTALRFQLAIEAPSGPQVTFVTELFPRGVKVRCWKLLQPVDGAPCTRKRNHAGECLHWSREVAQVVPDAL